MLSFVLQGGTFLSSARDSLLNWDIYWRGVSGVYGVIITKRVKTENILNILTQDGAQVFTDIFISSDLFWVVYDV